MLADEMPEALASPRMHKIAESGYTFICCRRACGGSQGPSTGQKAAPSCGGVAARGARVATLGGGTQSLRTAVQAWCCGEIPAYYAFQAHGFLPLEPGGLQEKHTVCLQRFLSTY